MRNPQEFLGDASREEDDRIVEALTAAIDRFFEEVDPYEFESEDLALSLLRALKAGPASE
ncbi:hypothetical protein ABZ508_34460 [Streptomyces lavendulocolor]|uniref:Uncharacterized protein n=1 Tax=Streptomyces lavendulocolor TaxID=67316 RepID=A0ABV2WGL2_9ACTN